MAKGSSYREACNKTDGTVSGYSGAASPASNLCGALLPQSSLFLFTLHPSCLLVMEVVWQKCARFDRDSSQWTGQKVRVFAG